MSTVRRVAKNTGVLIFADITSKLFSLILVIYIARFLEDVGYGKYSFALAFTALFAVLINLGLNMLTIREVARDKNLAGKYLGNIVVIKVPLSIITFCLIVFIINMMHYPADTTMAVYLAGISVILTSFSQLFRSIFVAFERMEYEAFLNIVKTIITVSLGLLVLFSGYGLIELVSVFVVAGLVDFCLSIFITLRKFVKPKIEIDLDFWKRSILTALPFALLSVVSIIYLRIDTVMLSVMKGDEVVGWYSAAYTILLAMLFIPEIFSYAIFPSMSKFFVSSKDALKTTLEKSSKYLFIIGLPTMLGLILLADKIVLIIYGIKFTNSIIALQILSLYLPLRFVNYILARTLYSIDKQMSVALTVTITAAANVVLNLFLIPILSFIGAAIATVLTEIILFALYFYFISKYFHRLTLHKIFIKPSISCLVMGIFIYQFKEIILFLLIPLATFLYFGLLYLLRTFSEEDMLLFKQVMKK
jgi:O-antigen/teichoic acid export membrane protein